MSAPITVRIPSERPVGDQIVDRIWMTFYPTDALRPPAVLVVHSLGEGRRGFLHRSHHHLAARLARRGIAAAVIELPYHMRRLPRGVSPLRLYTASTMQAFEVYDQAASDVSTAAKWLRETAGVDPDRVGLIGLSLGAIITHLAMGRDPTIRAGVAILGGGDLERLREKSLLAKVFHPVTPPLTESMKSAIEKIDPLTFASFNRPRRVLMIEAARDLVIPPANAVKLWEALGRPPIRWIDTNHFAPILNISMLGDAAAAYLQSVWDGTEPGQERIRPITAPVLKFGLLSVQGKTVAPALQWQAINLFRRPDHLTLMHLNVGLGSRGVFGAFALTVNPSLDVGVVREVNDEQVRPFASLHLVF